MPDDEQKKRNSRMKDALDETLFLSDGYRPDVSTPLCTTEGFIGSFGSLLGK